MTPFDDFNPLRVIAEAPKLVMRLVGAPRRLVDQQLLSSFVECGDTQAIEPGIDVDIGEVGHLADNLAYCNLSGALELYDTYAHAYERAW